MENNNNNNNNNNDAKNMMEEDVSMDDGIDDASGGGGGVQRHTTPVEGVDMSQVVSSSSSVNGVLASAEGPSSNGEVDPNKESLVTSTTASSPSSSSSSSPSSGADSSLLRPGNIIMMTLTPEDYEKEYWPRLENAIHLLLTLSPGQYAPLSYEQMYSCVYKCVCKQFSERLCNDLLAKVASHLANLKTEIAAEDAKTYIEKFNYALNQYLQALGGIVPIFNYMNRFYVESKLGTDLRKELLNLFKIHVVDPHSTELIPLLLDAQSRPFMIAPEVMANIVKQLHALCPDLVATNPQLFVRFIPNTLPPTSEQDLDALIEETRRMQEVLAGDPEFAAGGGGGVLKRALD